MVVYKFWCWIRLDWTEWLLGLLGLGGSIRYFMSWARHRVQYLNVFFRFYRSVTVIYNQLKKEVSQTLYISCSSTKSLQTFKPFNRNLSCSASLFLCSMLRFLFCRPWGVSSVSLLGGSRPTTGAQSVKTHILNHLLFSPLIWILIWIHKSSLCVCERWFSHTQCIQSGVWASLYILGNGKTQYDSCLLNYNIRCIAGYTEQGGTGQIFFFVTWHKSILTT